MKLKLVRNRKASAVAALTALALSLAACSGGGGEEVILQSNEEKVPDELVP